MLCSWVSRKGLDSMVGVSLAHGKKYQAIFQSNNCCILSQAAYKALFLFLLLSWQHLL
jgi:hypothetical protein